MNAKQGTILIAAQMAGLLDKLEKQHYTQPLRLFNGNTVGQHFRHILECYTCLFDGMPKSYVDYGNRQRNHTLSECPRAAMAVLDYIAHSVKQTDELQLLLIEGEFSEDCMGEHKRPMYSSSAGRELQYAFDHAVHHLAMIRMGLELYFPEVPLPDDLGVAPSTLKYRKATHPSENALLEQV